MMNFFGGPGESAHKFFVKAPGLKTQRRVKEFAVQTVKQNYNIMVTQYALRSIEPKPDQQRIFPNEAKENSDDVTVHLSGKYSLVLNNTVLQSMRDGNRIHFNWQGDRLHKKNDDDSYCLDGQLVTFILSRLDMMDSREFNNGYRFEGYTRIITKTDNGSKILLYAHPSFQGKKWYD